MEKMRQRYTVYFKNQAILLKQYQIRTTDSFFGSQAQDLSPEPKQRGATQEHKGHTLLQMI